MLLINGARDELGCSAVWWRGPLAGTSDATKDRRRTLPTHNRTTLNKVSQRSQVNTFFSKSWLLWCWSIISKLSVPKWGKKAVAISWKDISRLDNNKLPHRLQRKLDVHPCSSSMYGMLSNPPKNSLEIYGQNLNFKISVLKQPLISPLIFGKVCEPDLCGSFRTTPTAGWGV